MKFLVDSLPIFGEQCLLYDKCVDCDTSDCPMTWSKYDIEDKPHECCYLKEESK